MSIKKEIWIDIPDFEGLYQVSNKGRFKSYARTFILYHGGTCETKSKILKFTSRNGYLLIILRKRLKRYTFSAHRIVASVFVPNPSNKKQVNHKNGIKTDNRAKNLEWVTRSENMQHSYHILGRKGSKMKGTPSKIMVTQKSANGNMIKQFESLTEASRVTGISRHHIGKCVKGKRKLAGGYIWI